MDLVACSWVEGTMIRADLAIFDVVRYCLVQVLGKHMADFEPHRREALPGNKYDSNYLKFVRIVVHLAWVPKVVSFNEMTT